MSFISVCVQTLTILLRPIEVLFCFQTLLNGLSFQCFKTMMKMILATYPVWYLSFYDWFDLLCSAPLSAIFQLYIMATSFSGGRSRSTRGEPPAMGKQLGNCITCGCESSAPFLLFTKPGTNPRHIGDRLVLVVS